ncbi:Magnesium chelatase [Thermodesulfatator indicus DSM 15286]|uniref:Mg-protoporphyrin IX chelatase n=1 Tax=Thermodesulfatator indicus (strain DSM 15286 / JCM 11887 / CIR29812) TaxID=667014 RepID=F8ACY4_THEID|nr:ATP-binding protein [Thermodesulfatator indicus]AEH45850.1 Magnesium chelatase [Thermodesulfatator indicus DSM 15286]
MRKIYPFSAIVGQDEMKLALILNVIDPSIGGVLIRGEKGTGKSTIVRSLADILPEIEVVEGCPYSCDPESPAELCPECQKSLEEGPLPRVKRKVRVVDLPLSATEDRLVGTLDIERALKTGEKHFEPGILAAAHRGILYVDEINLLEDHLVDLLLDAAAMGVNFVEREGISFSHPARFVLVGTMNPEEGELRPQLLDRFGLCVQVEGIKDPKERVLVIERRMAFEKDPEGFSRKFAEENKKLAERIVEAQNLLNEVEISEEVLYQVAKKLITIGVDGHRGDLTVVKTARAHAAFCGRKAITDEDLKVAEALALPHRLRRRPFEEIAF